MSRPASPRRITAGLAAALTIPLAGCIPTLATDDPSSSSPSSSSANIGPQHERAGRELTQADAEAALPDLPQGAQERSTEVTASHRKTDPESCLEVLRIGPTYDELAESRVASAKTAWYVQTDGGRQINVGIDSFPDEIGPDLLDRAGAALGECSSFSMRGWATPVTSTTVSGPTVGPHHRSATRASPSASPSWPSRTARPCGSTTTTSSSGLATTSSPSPSPTGTRA